MCSWCWGFEPTLAAVQARLAIPVRLVLGGLRPGPNAQPLTDDSRDMILHHWQQVESATSQPFDPTGLDRPNGWKYDTELPSIATVTMRAMAPALAIPFYHLLQKSFYAEKTDLTDRNVYRGLVEQFLAAHPGETSVTLDTFIDRMSDPESKRETWADFAWARKMGVSGFPTLLLRDGSDFLVASPGWSAPERLIPALERWLADNHAPELEGLVCDIETGC